MSRPVEEWLKSFQCEEYADNFDFHGYKTLESVFAYVWCTHDQPAFHIIYPAVTHISDVTC